MSHARRRPTSPARQTAPRGRRRRQSTLGWIAVIVFAFLAGIGAIGAVAVVAAYGALANDDTLPDVSTLTEYELPEETILLDRTGETELARFGDFKRSIVTYDEIPPIVLDATTAIEDKTFWENAGFDPLAIVAAGLDSIRGDSRGASTITQQLVRARLLDEELVQDPARTVERKLKEIIQSIRLTREFQGEAGKREIITAYLNQNYYGNQTYGVKAAYERYFGKAFTEENVTPAEAAILAALPQSPSNYDLVRNAIVECGVTIDEGAECPAAETTLYVPEDARIYQRRNVVLDLLAEGRTPISGDTFSAADFRAATSDDVLLAPQRSARWLAPHFVWAVRDELTTKLCGPDATTCNVLERGGLRVTTTVDLRVQRIAERWVEVAAHVPHRSNPEAVAEQLGIEYEPWMRNLEDKNVRNGALVAYDYQTGELIAYVGSARYYATKTSPEFQPQYDVIGQGYRQPGSAFKPFNYAVGIDDRVMTAGTVFMDSSTDFGGGYTPNNADRLERGPVRVRTALQFSLNIPSVKAMAVNGPDHVFERAKEMGMQFQSATTDAGLALALGVAEVRPIDLVTAYGALANGGRTVGRTTILTVRDRDGVDVIDPYVPPEGEQVVSAQAAYVVTDILDENTIRRVNPFWGAFQVRSAEGDRRPATLKTGTNNDAKDLNAYGYIAPPTEEARADGAYALAVGVWNGNSDNTPVSTPEAPVFSIDISTYVWQAFLNEAAADWPIARFERPGGLVEVAIDPWTGAPSSAENAVAELFIEGTQPTASQPENTCGDAILRWMTDNRLAFEARFGDWLAADLDWISRAERGAGTVGGPDRTRVAYFYNGGFTPYGPSWGAIVGGDGCGSPSPPPTCIPLPTPDPSGVIPSFELPTPTGSEVVALPCPTPTPDPNATPSEEPSPSPSPTPEDTPTPEPTPPPATPTPAPEPTPPPATPTPAPTAPPATPEPS
ncbi:MAG: transglycosylase domain-containing protein [Candidatus Limnocylindria bacterium]